MRYLSLTDKMISLDVLLPIDVSRMLASRVKARRLELNLTQEGIARKADVKLPTYRKFEREGAISLNGLLKIAFAMGMLQDFEQLFNQRKYETLDDVINETKIKRKRGHKK